MSIEESGTIAVSIKMPKDIRAWLEKEAEANHRSMTGQINFILDQAKTASETPQAA